MSLVGLILVRCGGLWLLAVSAHNHTGIHSDIRTRRASALEHRDQRRLLVRRENRREDPDALLSAGASEFNEFNKKAKEIRAFEAEIAKHIVLARSSLHKYTKRLAADDQTDPSANTIANLRYQDLTEAIRQTEFTTKASQKLLDHVQHLNKEIRFSQLSGNVDCPESTCSYHPVDDCDEGETLVYDVELTLQGGKLCGGAQGTDFCKTCTSNGGSGSWSDKSGCSHTDGARYFWSCEADAAGGGGT